MNNFLELMLSLIPHGDTANAALKIWPEKRIKEKRDIYFSKVRRGAFDNIDKDDTVSTVYRLMRAVAETVSKNNFRLLCRLIQGLGTKEQLTALNFLKFCSVLENLSEREVKIRSFDAWQHFNPNIKKSEKAAYWRKILGKDVWRQHSDEWESFDDEYYALLRTGLYSFYIVTKGNANV